MIKELNTIFDDILNFAERHQRCLRKAVGCAAITIVSTDVTTMVSKNSEFINTPLIITMEHNGPSREGHKCTNEVGNCGCSHSEPRIVRNVLQIRKTANDIPLILVCTYSPCTNCANIIIDSGLFSGVLYDILTEHDKRGLEFLKQAMPVMSKHELNNLSDKEASDTLKKWISN